MNDGVNSSTGERYLLDSFIGRLKLKSSNLELLKCMITLTLGERGLETLLAAWRALQAASFRNQNATHNIGNQINYCSGQCKPCTPLVRRSTLQPTRRRENDGEYQRCLRLAASFRNRNATHKIRNPIN
jgi:hypothetical protein